MSESKQSDVSSRRMTRRGLIKTVGVGVGAATVGGIGLEQSGGAEALSVTHALAAGGPAGATIHWLLGDFSPFSSDSPPDGLSASALKQRVRQTAKTRKSTNASTIVDNQNIISAGLENTLYIEGKTAAVEALNNGKTQSEVQSAAIGAMEAHLATVQANLLKTWNESVNEAITLHSSAKSHPDVTADSLVAPRIGSNMPESYDAGQGISAVERSISLADGSSMTVQALSPSEGDSYDPLQVDNDSFSQGRLYVDSDIYYLVFSDWNGVWTDLQTVKTDVNDGLVTWVENVYGQVQSGDLELGDLTTPRMRANQMAEEKGGEANAIADLQALNIPIASGEKTTVEIEKSNATLTLSGTLAYTGDKTIQPGTTYNPSSWGDAIAYFTYDQSTASGTWSAYQDGIDGGIVSFTAKPTDGTAYRISTTANESVTVQGSEFTPVDSSGATVDPASTTPDHWQVDLSDQLATPIAEVSGVKLASGVTESKTKTVILDDPFTVTSIKRDGESVDSATFEKTEPQTDSNYITQEQWKEMEQQNQELIEKYEASQNSGGGFSFPGLGGLNLGTSGGLLGGAAVVLGGLGFLKWLSGPRRR